MKILVLRFSSIGDIVLTTPILRAIKQQIPHSELHFLTKKSFHSILNNNPNIDQLLTFEKSIDEVKNQLKKEKYDCIIDLHRNIRTLSLKLKLKRPWHSFPKLNFKKFLLVKFKWSIMPNVHVVERYFQAVLPIGVQNDGLPCEFHIDSRDEINIEDTFGLRSNTFATMALGAQFATKRMPIEKMIEIIEKIQLPIIFVGDNKDQLIAEKLIAHFPSKTLHNACGKFNIKQSASIVKQSAVLLTHDTGLMHIASCFQTPIVSVWGNTVPELGMYPYSPNNSNIFTIHQVDNLSCRPCSKIGFQKCPKGHFDCMNLQNAQEIADQVKKLSGNKN